MAIVGTTILDLVPNEKVLGATVDLLLSEKNVLINSGLAVRNQTVDAVAGGGPRKASIPFIMPLATDEVNVGTDDITADGNTGKLTADEFTVLRHDLNYGWGTADLTQMVTKYDAKGGIAGGIADYWNGIYTKIAVSSMVGALKVNSGLTYTSTAGEAIYSAVINASATMGVHADDADILIVSPTLYAKMRIDEKNGFVPASKTESRFDEWAGFKLIKTKLFGETPVLARSGALAFGEGNPAGMVPIEIERLANKGTGQGATILHSRRSIVSHVQGFEYKGAVAPTVLKVGSTAPAIETASNWGLALSDLEMIGLRKIVLTPAA